MYPGFANHAIEFMKLAELSPIEPEKKKPSLLKTVGKSALGVGVGTFAGFGVGKALEMVVPEKYMGRLIPAVTTIAGGTMGMAIPLWHAYERQEIEDARDRS